MQWTEAVAEQINGLTEIKINSALVNKILHLLDYTSLNDSDTESSVAAFLEKAHAVYGHVAAVCVYPRFVRMAVSEFTNSPIQVASVANFPSGAEPLEEVLISIGRSLEDGAQEIDVVFPYHRYLAGEQHYAHDFVAACKSVCGEKALLKVILETGELNDPAIIADASFDALTSGADFIKTSTGKISQGATPEAVATMLLVIKHTQPKLNRPLGVKVSGGVRTIEQAAQYIQLADNIMGREWVKPTTFRIGASKLLDELLAYQQ